MQTHFIDILINAVLAIIMFGIGLSLKASNFVGIAKKPKVFLIGLSMKMVFLPMLAFALCFLTDLSPEIKVGIVVLSVCPGGTTSNLITYLMDGNTELSIALTTVNSFLAIITIPLIVNLTLLLFLGSQSSLHLPLAKTTLQIFYIIIIPAALGAIVNNKFPKFTSKVNRQYHLRALPQIKFNILKLVTSILLAVVFFIKIFANESSGGAGLIANDFKTILPVLIVFNIVGLFAGYFSILPFGSKKDAMTVGIEVGLINTTLAFLIAGTFLQNAEMQKPALIYAFFSFWTSLLFAYVVRRMAKISSNKSEN